MRQHPPLRSGDTKRLHQLIKRSATHPRHIVDQKAEPNGLPRLIIRGPRPNRPGGTFCRIVAATNCGRLGDGYGRNFGCHWGLANTNGRKTDSAAPLFVGPVAMLGASQRSPTMLMAATPL